MPRALAHLGSDFRAYCGLWHSKFAIWSLALLSIGLSSSVWAQPANDYFTNATVITGVAGTISGSSVGATNIESGDPDACGWHLGNSGTVWYSWTAPTNGAETFIAQSSTMNIVIGIYTGTNITNLVLVGCDHGGNNFVGSTNSTFTFNATTGTVYKVEVAGFFIATGNFNLSWFAATNQSDANDNFANAQVISGPAGSVSGDNKYATHETGEPFNCGIPGGFSVWYVWTNSASGPVTFNTEGSDFDSTLGVYTGTNVANLISVGCNNDVAPPGDVNSSVTFNSTAGTVYYISVDGAGSSQGDVVLNWSTAGASSLTAGSFRFTSGRYIYSESESAPVRNGFMRFIPGRLTVTRTGGTVGRVQVGYNVTSGVYTNIVITSVFGTNITQMGGGTNYYFTNAVETDYFQNNDYGTYDYYIGASQISTAYFLADPPSAITLAPISPLLRLLSSAARA